MADVTTTTSPAAPAALDPAALDPAALDPARLEALAGPLAERYRTASPWPHVVVPDLFPAEVLEAVRAEAEAVPESAYAVSRSRDQVKEETSEALGPAAAGLLAELDGEAFRSFLSRVTGIADLVADPSHLLAGLHRTGPGGFTNVHRDFPVHPATGLHHRVNVLVYLNSGWLPAYGGTLELWPLDMSALGARGAPTFGTTVIFETTPGTLHGLPDPVACPPGQARHSLAAYYYTAEPAPNPIPAGTVYGWFERRPQDSWRVARLPAKDLVRSWLPASVRRQVAQGLARLSRS